MSVLLSRDQIVRQSNAAYDQWKELWRENALRHKKMEQLSFEDLRNTGIGKTIVLVANGASLENDMETIEKYKDNTDIFVCDKTLGHCIKRGIKPKYCLLADAKVSYEQYCEPYKNELKDTILFANVCGNPKWTHDAEWKKIYFFVNKDVINSEKEFMAISGCKNELPAGSNVSNAMVILMTQADNKGPQNFFNYDKILLTGFDYGWKVEGNYYAYDKDAGGKFYFMRHQYCQDIDGKFTCTSGNLAFSAKWLYSYVTTFRLPVIQCSMGSIMPLPWIGKLKDHIGYKFDTKDGEIMIELNKKRFKLFNELNDVIKRQNEIQGKHNKFVRSTL